LIRVVRRKKSERTKRKIGIAAATKAMILKIIFHCHFCCSGAVMALLVNQTNPTASHREGGR
jgi:hypothetical protein